MPSEETQQRHTKLGEKNDFAFLKQKIVYRRRLSKRSSFTQIHENN